MRRVRDCNQARVWYLPRESICQLHEVWIVVIADHDESRRSNLAEPADDRSATNPLAGL